MGKKAFGSVVRFGMGSWLAGPTGRRVSAGLPWVCAACTSLTVFTVGIVAPEARAQTPPTLSPQPTPPQLITVRTIGPFFTSSRAIAESTTQCDPLDSFEATDVIGENAEVRSISITSGSFVTINLRVLDSGPAYVRVPAGSFQAADDCADSAELPRTLVGRFDLGPPVPAISLAAGAIPSLTNPFNIIIAFTINEGPGNQPSTRVMGFELGDFDIDHATVTGLAPVTDTNILDGRLEGSVYQATITPDATIPSGETVTVRIEARSVENLAGRVNTVASATLSLEQATVPDRNLRNAITDQLGIPRGSTILVSQIASLQSLSANGYGIEDLTGLEDATSLRSLRLGRNNLESDDLAVLATLARGRDTFTKLNLNNNNITDLDNLSSLRDLRKLKLSRNRISDVGPLSGITNLDELRIEGNDITDIEPLMRGRLAENDILLLTGNPLNIAAYDTHIPELLFTLRLGTVTYNLDPRVVDSIPDAGLRRAITDSLGRGGRSPVLLSDIPRLTTLRANNLGIGDLTGLESATRLTELLLNRNNISDLSPLEDLAGLRRLTLSSNNISNISPLTNLTSLEILNLSSNDLSNANLLSSGACGAGRDSLSSLGLLRNLRILRIHSNNIPCLDWATSVGTANGRLERLALQNNGVVDIGPLVNNTGLGTGDIVQLTGNADTLNAAAYSTHIPALQDPPRSVTVQFSPRSSRQELVTATSTGEDVAISISAVEASVIEGEPAQFQLTAAPAPTNDLVVAIAVADPDGVLTDTPPTEVTIEADQSTFTLELETDNDEIDELDATVTVTLEETPETRYTVAEAPDNSASVTVMDNDGLTQERRERGIEHALGAFGRAAGWDLVETIRKRSRNSTVEGKAFEITNLPTFGVINMGRPGSSIEVSSIDLSRLLDSEIRVAFNPQVAQASRSGSSNKSPLVRAWVKASRTDVESNPFEGRTQEGELTIGRFGIDAAYSSGWLFGSVFSWHDGNIEFDDTDFDTTGEVGIDLLSINPYISLTKDKLHLWGTIGGGFGDLSYEDSPGGRTTSTDSDLRMLTAAAGAEYEFGRLGPFDLKGRGESMVVNLDAEDSSHVLVGYEDIGVTVYGARGELELGLPLQLDNDQTELRPYVFTGLRQDGGLGNDLVLEYGGGFALSTGSVVAEGSIRSQSSSEDDGVELRGYSISLAYDRGNDRKGLVARVEQSAGPSAYDPYGVGALSSLGSRAGRTSSRLHVGYGIGLDEKLLRPFVAMDWGESQESELDLGLEYQYSDGSASLVYSGGDGSNLRFRFQKLF